MLDVFQFADEAGFLRLNADAPAEISRMLESVVAGSDDVPTLLRGKLQSLVYATGGTAAGRSLRQRALAQHRDELIADDAPGLLYRTSRVISLRVRRRSGADLDRRQEGR